MDWTGVQVKRKLSFGISEVC